MGCGASKKHDTVVPVQRRRLSLGEIGDDDGADTSFQVSEEDRSMLMELTQQQLFNFVQTEGRRYSLGSQTDQKMHEVQSFGSKTTKLEGEAFDASSENIGYACKKGLKPEAPNQDSFLIMKIEGQYAVYGVFDGHGRKGHDVSNFVKENLPKILFSSKSFADDPQEALKKSFEKMQYLIEKATVMKTIDATRSGTTCSVVLHCIQKKCFYVAHVGDSRVVLGKRASADSAWEAVDLTIDHKPDLPEERARIEKNGGVVVFDGGWNYRVFAKGKKDARGKRYPGLNMSRAMGDLTGYHDAGISASPDVSKQILPTEPTTGTAPPPEEEPSGLTSCEPSVKTVQIHPETDKFLLLCSDGVWEFIASQAAVQEVARFKTSEATNAAEHLASQAWQRWIAEMDGQVVDDITVVLIHLDRN
jgi:serine/threonine protein phosphatase PrpC